MIKAPTLLYSFDQYQTKDLPSTTVPDGVSDEQLMERIKHGDEAALAILYDRHHALLRAIVGRMINNDQDVDDVVQECLLELWWHAAKYCEEKGHALAWIVTVVRRRSIDRIRRKTAYLHAKDRFLEEVKVRGEAMHAGADDEVAQKDRAQALIQLIGRLPKPQQQAVTLAFYGNMSQRQIAAHTGIPLGTIKTRLKIALRRLRAAATAFGELRDDIHAVPAT